MLAQTYKGQQLHGNWYVSEKYDGIRGIWKNGWMYTKSGRRFRYVCPKFIKKLPDINLDGELIIPNAPFNEFSSLSVTKKSNLWDKVVYNVFDTPPKAAISKKLTPPKPVNHGFKDRLAILEKTEFGDNIKLIDFHHKKNITKETVQEYYKEIVKKGGEGIMLIHENNIYKHKRTNTLLKYKKINEDEAKVVGYLEGKGKYRGFLGKYVCQFKDIIFKLGSGLSDELRYSYMFEDGVCVSVNSPKAPQIDDLVTFKYMELTKNGVPRLPVFKGKRTD